MKSALVKIIIVFVVIVVIFQIFGDYLTTLVANASSVLPKFLAPVGIIVVFLTYVSELMFSMYYISTFVWLGILLFLFSTVITWLTGLPMRVKQSNELKKKEAKSKAAAEARYQSDKARADKKGYKFDHKETVKDYKVGK